MFFEYIIEHQIQSNEILSFTENSHQRSAIFEKLCTKIAGISAVLVLVNSQTLKTPILYRT